MMIDEVKEKCEKENQEIEGKIKLLKTEIRKYLRQVDWNKKVLKTINKATFQEKYKKSKEEKKVENNI